MSAKSESESETQPVYVIETIPTGVSMKWRRTKSNPRAIPVTRTLARVPRTRPRGMGHVHPATDRNLLRRVALKRLDKELAREPMYRDGFIAEAQMTGQLEHPNILPVHELAVSSKGIPDFTMKLVQGIGLDEWLRDLSPGPAHPNACRMGSIFFLRSAMRWPTRTIAA